MAERPPRVLLISAAFPPMLAGEAGHALHLAWRLANRGLDVHLLTTARPGTRNHYPFTVLPAMPDWSWGRAGTLAHVFRELDPDAVLLVYAGWNYAYHPMVTYAPLLARRHAPRARFVTQVECPGGAVAARTGPLQRLIGRAVRAVLGGDYHYGRLLTDSDGLIVLSHAHLAELATTHHQVINHAEVFPPAPLIALQSNFNGQARRDGRQLLRFTDRDFVVAFNGLIGPARGLGTLLRALAIAAPLLPALRLAVVGGVVNEQLPENAAHLDELRKLAAGLGVESRVTWTGAFDPAQPLCSRCLWAADAAVLPWDEGVHMNNSSVANAAAHHLPIITTRPALLEPIFEDGHNVLLVPPKDPDQLAQAILRVAGDAQLRARLSRGAAQLERDWYDWDRVLDRTLHVLSLPTSAGDPLSAAA